MLDTQIKRQGDSLIRISFVSWTEWKRDNKLYDNTCSAAVPLLCFSLVGRGGPCVGFSASGLNDRKDVMKFITFWENWRVALGMGLPAEMAKCKIIRKSLFLIHYIL